jgi:hypothetical protein
VLHQRSAAKLKSTHRGQDFPVIDGLAHTLNERGAMRKFLKEHLLVTSHGLRPDFPTRKFLDVTSVLADGREIL